MKRHAILYILTVFLFGLLAASCGQDSGSDSFGETQQPDAQAISYYEELLRERDVTQVQEETLYDIFTGEPQCISAHAEEDTGLDGPGGSPYTNTFSALYDLEGKLLYEKEEITYSAGFGDYIIRTYVPSDKGELHAEYSPENMVGVVSSLWNYKTGKEVLADVYSLTRLDKDSALAENAFWKTLGIIDREAKPLSGFPPAQSYLWPRPLDDQSGCFSADIGDPMSPWGSVGHSNPVVLLDRGMNERMVGQGYLRSADAPGYAIHGEGERTEVLLLPEAKTVFSLDDGSSLEYYDGEFAIQFQHEEAYPYRLLSAEGKPLSGWYEDILPFRKKHFQPAEGFLFLANGKLEKWGRDLQVQSTAAVPVRTIQLEDSLITYSGQAEEPGYWYDKPEGLLSADLEVLIPDEKYRNISPLYHWEKGTYQATGFLSAVYDLDNAYISDLLDSKGTVLVEKLNEISYVAPGLFRVEKGFDVGIMDEKGNWLYRRSKFTDFEDD